MVLLAAGLIWVIVALGVVATGLLGLALLMIVVLKRSSEQAADETLAPLRAKVSDLMERCDRLKGRLDRASGASDASVPDPTGQAAEQVADAQAKLDEITEVWLWLQKTLETAREHGETGQNVSGAQFREAAEMIDADEIETRFESAKAASTELDAALLKLEGAPIRAVLAIEAATAGLSALGGERAASGDASALRERLDALPAKPWTDPVAVAVEAEAVRARVATLGEQGERRLADGASSSGHLAGPLPGGESEVSGGEGEGPVGTRAHRSQSAS